MITQKRTAVTLNTKKEIIEAAENSSNKTELANQFGIKRPTLQNILKNKEGILAAIDDGNSAKRKRVTKGKHEDVEKSLVRWVKTVRSQNIPVTGELLKVSNSSFLSFLLR